MKQNICTRVTTATSTPTATENYRAGKMSYNLSIKNNEKLLALPKRLQPKNTSHPALPPSLLPALPVLSELTPRLVFLGGKVTQVDQVSGKGQMLESNASRPIVGKGRAGERPRAGSGKGEGAEVSV